MLRIIHYHRFQQPRARVLLERQCDYLRSNYDVVPMKCGLDRLIGGYHSSRKMIVVCVDDGHYDSYSVAFPTFLKYRIPAICYLVTGFVDGVDWLWCDKIAYLCMRSQRDRIFIDRPAGGHFVSRLGSPSERARCADRLKDWLKLLPNRERLDVLQRLPSTFGVSLPCVPPDEYRSLSWGHAREMMNGGISFGVHTDTHPILSRISEAEIEKEVAISKRRLEAELDIPAVHFCYPNGHLEDLGVRTPDILRRYGFRTAVTTIPGVNDAHTDRLKMHRIWVRPDFSLADFCSRLTSEYS